MSRKSQLSKRRNGPNKAGDQEVREQVLKVVKQELRHYSGPVPEAAELERYEKICPGYAQSLLDMARANQEHQREMDKAELALQDDFTRRHHRLFGRGQIIAGILAFSALGCGTAIAMTTSPQYGAAIIGATMAALTGAFVWGKWQESKRG